MATANELDPRQTVILDMPVSLSMALRPLWSAVWRIWAIYLAAYLLNSLVVLVLGGMGYGLLAHRPMPSSILEWTVYETAMESHSVIGIAQFIQSCVIQLAILNLVFQKSWRYFSLVPRDAATGAPIALSYWQTVKLWWSLTWRQVLLTFGFTMALGMLTGIGIVILGKGSLALDAMEILLAIGVFVGFTYILLKTNAIVMQKRYSDFAMTVVLRNPA